MDFKNYVKTILEAAQKTDNDTIIYNDIKKIKKWCKDNPNDYLNGIIDAAPNLGLLGSYSENALFELERIARDVLDGIPVEHFDIQKINKMNKESSIRTKKNGCTGCEATVRTKKNPVSDDDEDVAKRSIKTNPVSDDDEDTAKKSIKTNPVSDDDEDTAKSSCRTKFLKEEMIYYSGEKAATITESADGVHLLCESIKNHSASKFLSKQADKITKDAEKLASKGKKEEAEITKEAGKTMKEASHELYKAEVNYKNGNPEAKKQYKDICKKYSKILSKRNKFGKVLGRSLGGIAGLTLLTFLAFTNFANEDVMDRIKDGIKNGDLKDVLKSIGEKNKDAFDIISGSIKDSVTKSDAKYDLENTMQSAGGALISKNETYDQWARRIEKAQEEGLKAGIGMVKDTAWIDGYKDDEQAKAKMIKPFDDANAIMKRNKLMRNSFEKLNRK